MRLCLFRGGLEVGEAVGNGLAVLVGRMIVQAGSVSSEQYDHEARL